MNLSLNSRFLAPPGWRTHSFTNPETGHKIHYGSAFPKDAIPTAIIVCLPGLSEFTEKYYELAHDMLARGYAFWCIDWHYQGRSGRHAKYPHRRHSDGFSADISDLHKLVADYIKPSAVHPDCGRIPLIMLGHSFGGNIGLRYVAQYPSMFHAAAFTAPFLGIKDLSAGSKILSTIIRPFLSIVGETYIPNGRDWSEDMRKSDGTDIFSSDPLRDKVHNFWAKSDPVLQIGNPTYRWVVEGLNSCATLCKAATLQKITIPVLIATAGDDTIVDNAATAKCAAMIPNHVYLDIPGARHEILMEKDEYRNAFLSAFDKMVEEHRIATIEKLKPF
jgi:lysophospholipase